MSFTPSQEYYDAFADSLKEEGGTVARERWDGEFFTTRKFEHALEDAITRRNMRFVEADEYFAEAQNPNCDSGQVSLISIPVVYSLKGALNLARAIQRVADDCGVEIPFNITVEDIDTHYDIDSAENKEILAELAQCPGFSIGLRFALLDEHKQPLSPQDLAHGVNKSIEKLRTLTGKDVATVTFNTLKLSNEEIRKRTKHLNTQGAINLYDKILQTGTRKIITSNGVYKELLPDAAFANKDASNQPLLYQAVCCAYSNEAAPMYDRIRSHVGDKGIQKLEDNGYFKSCSFPISGRVGTGTLDNDAPKATPQYPRYPDVKRNLNF